MTGMAVWYSPEYASPLRLSSLNVAILMDFSDLNIFFQVLIPSLVPSLVLP